MSNRDREDLREAGQDAALERAWRDDSAEQPSTRVDAAILAAAHEAVANRKRMSAATPRRVLPRQRWNRLAPMVAAASVAGLAFMLVQTLPRDVERPPTPAAQESAKAAAEPADAPTPAPSQPDIVERQRVESSRADDSGSPVAQEQAGPPSVMAAPSPVPAPPAAMPAENPAGEITAASQVPSVGSNESRSDAGAKRGVVADSIAAGAAASAEERATRILALHDSGEVAAAADALRAFRATEPHADRYLPAQIREWAGTVQ